MALPEAIYRFGPFELRCRTRELFKQGTRLKIRPQPFLVLQALIERHGEVITREELRRLLWDGETFVDFEHGLNTAIKELRGLLNDSANEPRFIETLPKLGYRVIVPITTSEPASGGARTEKADGRAASVAVLPFVNLSADPENEFFADGITEDVITHLAKIKSLKVISRTSVMAYKRRDLSELREIGQRLGASTLLEGSVRRAGSRVRIVAQLIDCATDEHLWAETYDRDLTDIFAIQTDVALNIANALRAELSHDERARVGRQPTEDLAAYELY